MAKGQLTKDRKHESNPFRPDLPELIRDISPNLYDNMRETAETLREQHNLTQAGDSTFSWEILTEVDLERRYNVGSTGRFYHPQFGIITARYCRFSGMRETDWEGAPLGLRTDSDSLKWTVTNDFSKSSPDAVIGVGGFYVIPPEGSFGWVIVNGANIQALGFRKRTPPAQFDKFVWSANDRVTVATDAEGKVFGSLVGVSGVEQISGEDGDGDFFLATTADREGTEAIMRFQPLFWTTNFPSTMIASLTTDGETLIVDAEFTREDDLCGFIWESEDTWDHPLTAYDENIDYSNCVLSFTMEITGDTLPLDDVNGPVLTIEGNDGFGAPHIWYVRLWNYVTSGTNVAAQIVMDFDNLAGGFAMDDPVTPTEISRMFIGIVPASYTTVDPGPLATKEVCQVKLSNIVASGSNAVLICGTGTAAGELRMTNGYDDTYNLTPERLVRNVYALGYRDWFNHYVGMSHYFSWEWDAGEARFIAQDSENPLNGPCQIWHTDLCKRLQALDYTVIFSISYEMLNSFIPASWRQMDSDGLPALTGWEPPSSLFSPCNETGMAYLNRVFVAFADILSNTLLPIHMQVGEPWWWIDFRDFKPYFYDDETTAKWESETGLSTPIMTTMVGSKTNAEIQYLNWLGARLAESTAEKIQSVRDKYEDMVSYVLVYLPQILSGFAGTPDTPEAKRVNMPVQWARPAFDILQLEDYDFVINNEPHLSEAGRLLAEERLQYPREEQQYFSGFVLFKEDEQIWEYSSYAIRQAWEFGVPEVFVWAYTQVMRDGYVNLLTSAAAFRQWEIPAGMAFINFEADSEKRIREWINGAVEGSINNIAALQQQVKAIEGAGGLGGLTTRIGAAEAALENNAYLISKESEQRSLALYFLNERVEALESTGGSGGYVTSAVFLELQGIVNSLQGDFTSYIGFNNGRVDALQTQMESVLAYGNLSEVIDGIYADLATVGSRITNLRFWNLFDVPTPADVSDPYAGLGLYVPRVKVDGSGLEWYIPLSLPSGGTTGQILQKFGSGDGEATWSDLTAGIVAFTPTGGLSSTDVQAALAELDSEKLDAADLISTFLGLTDVPDSYTGHGLKIVQVLGDETGVTFSPLTAGITAFTPAGGLSSTDVQSALVELDTEKMGYAGGIFSGDISVPDEAYGGGWNGSTEVPTKNAIYDIIESLALDPGLVTDAGTYVQIKDGDGNVAIQIGGAGDPGTYSDNTTHYFRSKDGSSTFISFSASLFTSNVPISVPGDAYGGGWNGSTQVPTKDAIYDKIEAMVSDIASKLTGSPIDNGDALIPTINSPWINYGGGFGGARYFKDAAGIVHIEGLIQAPGGSSTSGVTLFTLLAGYRPADTMMFATWNGGGAGRIDVDSAGNVIMQSGNTAFTSLSGISFVPA